MSNSYVYIKSGKFKVKNADANNENLVVKYIICKNVDYSLILNELINWKPHHTHQLICSTSFKNKIISETKYSCLPLSTYFSYESVLFVQKIIQKSSKTDSKLYGVNRHFITENPLFLNNANLNVYMKFDNCKDFSNFINQSQNRINFLIENQLNLYTQIDPDLIRIIPEVSNCQILIKELKEYLYINILPNKKNTKSEEWLKRYIKIMPNFVVLMFVEFVIGYWGTNALNSQSFPKINLVCSEEENVIETIQDEHLLVIGKFEDEEIFLKEMKKRLQEYADSQFCSV